MLDCRFLQFARAHFAAAWVASWVSPPAFWPLFTRIAFLAINLPRIIQKELLRAHGLDKIMQFVLCLFIYLHIAVAIPSDIANGLNHFVETLPFNGAASVLADGTPGEDRPHV